ncbi:hypothetical protein LUZ61_017935 [Rhynchospora tenuis]|uniref:PMI1/PMIR1-2 C-terminal domain-containing protein n=1 Tax=Rhynchospora tenuis TaxID=198213 RepID=A0AAD6ELI8_9POAL|nr:hypothetical protein LUZ61_017935 [Rhynchospora tenuis]
MSNKNPKKYTSDSIAPSNWCTHHRFFFSMRGGTHKLQSTPPPPPLPDQSPLTAARVSLSPDLKKRLRDLERDIDRLKARIIREKPPAKRWLSGEDKEGAGPAMVRFRDGSFLHETAKVGKPWERLCMHVSLPTVAEDATTAAEVLQRMTTIKMDDLCRCLMSLMPMIDITGLKLTGSASQPYHASTELDFLIESILFDSLKMFEELVLEGLKIQMGTTRSSANSTKAAAVAGTDLEAASSESTASRDWVVLVVLIQVRDPKEDLGSVGELMIGLIEAQLGENGALQFSIEGVHVAGLNLGRHKIDGRDFMWSASWKCCGGSDGSGLITRNPDRLFPCSI